MIYDQTFKMSFQRNWKPFSTMQPTGAMRGSFREKLYQELGLEIQQ